MSLTKLQKQVLALSAVVQSAYLIHQLGQSGQCNEEEFATNIHSIYTLNAPSFESIYGKISHLKLGLRSLIEILQPHKPSYALSLISRCTLDMVFLQHKLSKNKAKLTYIKKKIKQAVHQKNFYENINDTIISNLADIYVNSVSQLKYKAQIIGKAQFIKTPEVFNKIRALLLAGIRASMLWQQMGGRKWHLFFARKKLLKEAKSLYSSAN